MKLTYIEAINHIKKNGISRFRITEKMYDINADTVLWFDITHSGKYLTTMGSTLRDLNHDTVDNEFESSWRCKYNGMFEVVEPVVESGFTKGSLAWVLKVANGGEKPVYHNGRAAYCCIGGILCWLGDGNPVEIEADILTGWYTAPKTQKEQLIQKIKNRQQCNKIDIDEVFNILSGMSMEDGS